MGPNIANYMLFRSQLFKYHYLVVMSILRKDKLSLLLIVSIHHSIPQTYHNLLNHFPAIKYFLYMYKFSFLSSCMGVQILFNLNLLR